MIVQFKLTVDREPTSPVDHPFIIVILNKITAKSKAQKTNYMSENFFNR